MSRIFRSWRFVVGIAVLSAIAMVAVLAHWLAPFDPWAVVGAQLLPPGGRHVLGTDMLGRDVMSGLIFGARVSLVIGIVSTAFSLVLGTAIGALAGYFGGAADRTMMRFTEFFQVIPSFLFVVLLVAIMTPSVANLVIGIALVIWPPVARLVRSEFMTLREREFVEAARGAGLSDIRIIFTEIMPNALPPVLAVASLMVATAILTEASLSFLGLADPNMISWGYMIGAARTVFRQAWWLSVFPGLALLVTVLAVTLLAEAIGDRSNPTLRSLTGG
ncbi:MAG: ABC transporter permease [Burkholderiaceae bacterium]|nr:ABC transporter permease [Burkholderiaceae bacterium]